MTLVRRYPQDFPPGKRRKPPMSKVMLLLRIVEAANGEIDSSENRHSMLNYFCGDFEPTDTYNAAIDLGYLKNSFNSMFETSEAKLTDAGRAALLPTRERGGADR